MRKVILLLGPNQRDYKKIIFLHKKLKMKNQIFIPRALV
jgi:hypothetical protein